MKIKLDEGAIMPTRAHEYDAGLDLYSRDDVDIIPYGTATFHTGVHIELPHGTAGLIISKSGLNIFNDVTSRGLIDEGYQGEIVVKLFNHGENSFHVSAGMKISQLVVFPVFYVPLELVDEFESETDRGSDGFGSTGLF